MGVYNGNDILGTSFPVGTHDWPGQHLSSWDVDELQATIQSGDFWASRENCPAERRVRYIRDAEWARIELARRARGDLTPTSEEVQRAVELGDTAKEAQKRAELEKTTKRTETREEKAEERARAAAPDTPAVSDAPPAEGSATCKEELPSMAITKIGDVVNHSALLTALNSIRAEVESRQEDVDNLAAWSGEMAERMNGIAEELKALKVDNYTVGNMNMLGDLLAGQKTTADAYKNATDISVNQAEVAARTAHRHHGRIQDAVDDSDAPMAQNTFYNAE